MKSKIHRYPSQQGEVTWDAKRCIHAAECVKNLPEVFDVDRKPWIQPDNADAKTLMEIIQRCPTGALHLEPNKESEALPHEVDVVPDGPLYLSGDCTLKSAEGEVLLTDDRIALCRCGLSANKPLCDGSHKNQFSDPGHLATDKVASQAPGTFEATALKDGPLKLSGVLTLKGDNQSATVDDCFLCRCGQSENKPFCDGSHKKAGFTDDA